MMKAELLVCLLLTFLQVDASVLFSFTTEERECIQELYLGETTIYKLYTPNETVENSNELNHFVHCLWLKLGFQNKDGAINYEKLSESYDIVRKTADDIILAGHDPGELFCEAINFCGNNPPIQSTINHGQTAVKVQNCLAKYYLYLKDKYGGFLNEFCHA